MSAGLRGIRVLELARVLAGPYCGMLLGDMGAEVIKVERPGAGDDLRGWGPPFTDDGESTYFLSVNRNKRSVAVDLKTDAGRAIVADLIRRSDVVIENFRPGGMEKLGFGADELKRLNPRLVHCSITAYGTSGPMRDLPGYDVIVQALGGLMSVTGPADGPPTRVGVAMVDIATGLYAALGIVSALRERDRTGRGQRVETSLLAVELACMPNLTAGYLMKGVRPRRLGNGHPNAAPYGVYRTSDGELVLAVGNDVQWRRLCEAVGRPEYAEHPTWARNGDRQARRAELDEMLEQWFASWTTADLTRRLTEFEVPNGPIQDVGEALDSPQTEAMGSVVEIEDDHGEPLRLVGSPLAFPDSEGAPLTRPPRLDEDRERVLREVLGYDDDTVAAAERGGAFGAAAA
jgi:crotonobetainyl-CoA:carnitine CoA-transferase CaiB-like acyl-CoA transferase